MRANAGRVAQRIETLDIVHICKKVPPKRTNNNEVASSDMNGSGLGKGGEVLLTTAKPCGTVACPEHVEGLVLSPVLSLSKGVSKGATGRLVFECRSGFGFCTSHLYF
jgi:hypothetical protein